jgi:hypothetical protein
VARPAVSLVLAAGIVVGAAGPQPALAQPAPAAAVAPADTAAAALSKAREAGERAGAGDYAGAVTLFKQASALDARPEYACNVGIAYYKARDLPRAHFFLETCLSTGSRLPADFLGSVKRVFETVEQRLQAGAFAPVEVRVSPAHARILVSSFASDEPVASGRRIWLRVGQHLFLATALRHETRQIAVDLVGRDPRRVDMVLEPLPGEAPPIRPPTTAPAAAPAPVPVAPAPVAPAATPPPPVLLSPIVHTDSRRRSPTRAFAIGASVGAVIGFTLSTVFYVAAEDAQSRADDGDIYAEVDASGYRYLAVTGYISTAILGVTAAVLWGQVSKQNRSPMVGASAGDGSASLWLGGRF